MKIEENIEDLLEASYWRGYQEHKKQTAEKVKRLKEPKTRITRLKKKFWKLYTRKMNENFKAFELMREIGIAQGKLQKFNEIDKLTGFKEENKK